MLRAAAAIFEADLVRASEFFLTREGFCSTLPREFGNRKLQKLTDTRQSDCSICLFPDAHRASSDCDAGGASGLSSRLLFRILCTYTSINYWEERKTICKWKKKRFNQIRVAAHAITAPLQVFGVLQVFSASHSPVCGSR